MKKTDQNRLTVDLGSIPISRWGMKKTLSLLGDWVDGPQHRRVATANLDFLRLSRGDEALDSSLRTADLVTADGAPLVWLSRLCGEPIQERVARSDLVLPLLVEAARRRRSVYLLGGSPGVARTLCEKLSGTVPGLRIAGFSEARVSLEDVRACEQLAESIRETGADLLLVAFGCPKQEIFLERYGPQSGCHLAMGVGATFDFLTGYRRRAPRIFRRIGAEWLFRLATEPRRLALRYAGDLAFLLSLCLRSASRRLARFNP